MKLCTRLLTVAAGLLAVNVALAQAPAGSTGQCKDGTYTNAPSKKGACRGHKGVQVWYAAESGSAGSMDSKAGDSKTGDSKAGEPMGTKSASSMGTKNTAPAAAPMAPMNSSGNSSAAPAKSSRHERASTSSMQQAAGGGPGMVWVNMSSKVYHCPGTKYYGKTKEGKYMSEADAKGMGAHPDHGNACSK